MYDRVARRESSKGAGGRSGFTLVEMMVAMALILFLMVILSEAFKKGIETFLQLKAIGDLEEKLRTASTQLRTDLSADHFEGKRRLSDPYFYDSHTREGFFRIVQGGLSIPEGTDSDGNLSYRASNHVLHFTVKLRGNKREDFFKAVLPATSPLLVPGANNSNGTFFNQQNDGRFQDTDGVYHSAWAEVVYFLAKTGQTAGSQTDLHTLYRTVLLVVPDNRGINWTTPQANALFDANPNYRKMSCLKGDTQLNNNIYFFNPTDLANGGVVTTNGAGVRKQDRGIVYPPNPQLLRFLPLDPNGTADTNPLLARQNIDRSDILLTDVISFDVQILKKYGNQVSADFHDLPEGPPFLYPPYAFDTHRPSVSSSATLPPYTIAAIQISLRVWDRKTEQTRQITIVQDM